MPKRCSWLRLRTSSAAIFGGAAGGGKSFALNIETLRHTPSVKGFDAAIFRRTLADAKKPGATISKCAALYGSLGARSRSDPISWIFPNGGSVTIGHLEHEEDKLTWQSSEIALLCFDELTHFTKSQFFYMLSRNRSMCGIRPYVRATTNPDVDSWVAEFIAWWINPETGYPIQERAGRVRWMVVLDDTIHWGDSVEEMKERFGADALPKSVTFVPSKLSDNPALMKADPGYLANLKALPLVERERLLEGNWKIRPAAGLYFNRAWVEFVAAAPADGMRVRYWDLAATEKTSHNDPDWTVGVLMSRRDNIFYVEHAIRMRASPLRVEQAILATASMDERRTAIALAQDPGQAGKTQAQQFVGKLAGYNVRTQRETGDKVTRFSPFSAQCQAGNVKIVKGPWNGAFIESLEGFPEAAHDDDADACAGAFDYLTAAKLGRVAIRDLVV